MVDWYRSGRAVGTKVPFNAQSVRRCICPSCPVQAESECVTTKTSESKSAMQMDPLRREDIPGVYCSTGVAACGDIDQKRNCICMSCPLWSEYDLVSGTPSMRFCRDGDSR